MYNFKNEEDVYLIKQLAISNQPIPFYNKTINIPLVKDIMAIKESDFQKIIYPFLLNKDVFKIDNNSKDVFSSIIEMNIKTCININNHMVDEEDKKTLLYNMINGFLLFFNANINDIMFVINDDTRNYFMWLGKDENKIVINDGIFNELSKIIRIITWQSEIHKSDLHSYNSEIEELELEEIEMIRNAKTERDKEKVIRFYEGLKKAKEEEIKNNKTLSINERMFKIYNKFSFVSGMIKSFDEVLKMNIYQLDNMFEFLYAKINHNHDDLVATSGYASEDFKFRDIRIETVK